MFKMSGKMYLHLLLFCGILCQGIFAGVSDEDNRVSSDLLVRKRRVVNNLPGGEIPVRIETANYVVKIREHNRFSCTGVILSHYTLLTAASCATKNLSDYTVCSGAAYPNRCTFHNVTWKKSYFGTPPIQNLDGIALMSIDLPFEYTPRTGNIHFYDGPLPAGTMVTVYGWGWYYPILPRTESGQKLRLIHLPIMNRTECRNIYENNSYLVNHHSADTITEKHICTYHEHQYCARNDAGAPLVVNNMLAGIHVWKGEYPGRRNPDVFINLQRADYKEWIIRHSILI